jgi:hypothetical protein
MKTKKHSLKPLQVGQIRKLKPNKNGGSSRLVLIAEQDRRDGTYLVFLLSNSVEAAIPRDLCMSKPFTTASYEIVLMTEYFSRANPEDFELESLIGQIDISQVERFRLLAFNNPFGKLPEEIICEGVSIGRYPMQKYDSIWKFRTAEFDNFLKLTFVRDEIYLISVDYALRALSQFEALNEPSLIDEMPLDALFTISRSRELVAA